MLMLPADMKEALARKRSVAVFSGYFDSHGGGMELATAELVRVLRQNDYQVQWVSQADKVRRSSLDDKPLPGTDLVYHLSGVPMPLPAPWALAGIWRAVKRADLVVAVEANFIVSALGFGVAKLLGKPTLLIQHVGQPSTVSRVARSIMDLGERLVVRPAIRSADALVSVSPLVARYYALDRPDVLAIGHKLDLETFRPAAGEEERRCDRERLGLRPEGKIASYVGRVTPSKGIGVMAPLARARPDWTFVVAGSGPVDVREWGLPNVLPLGQLSRNEVARLHRVSDAVVLPSPSESYSMVVREALACGGMVVCSEQILETDPALSPFLKTTAVDLNDIEGTAALFAGMLDEEQDWSDDSVRNYLETQCGWEATHGRYLAVIEALLRPAATPDP
ncbi:MAG: glycosyltransferase family 4 protein [Hyphomonadaceae bacterium]|nr:glycosyltransferase family 4 protein [Hyphomonadaceae bacterium]